MLNHVSTYIMYTAWRIDRGCSRVLEHEKPNLIQEPTSWLLFAVQSCYFIISWQHVLSCMNMYWPLIYHDGSKNVVQFCSFIKQWTLVCSNTHEQLSTTLLHEAGQLNHVRFTMLLYPYRQYTILFIFRFASLLCLRRTLRLFQPCTRKPVNNHVQAGQFNYVQAWQQEACG